jgi:hypothetical protein
MLYQKTLLNLTKKAQPCLGRISQKKKKNRTLKITHQVNYWSGSSSRQLFTREFSSDFFTIIKGRRTNPSY